MNGVRLQDAVAVVTGASSGIGRATAIALAERGCRVAIAARSEEDLEEVAQQCEAKGREALAVPTDVSRVEDVEELGRRVVERFGGFDIRANAAAVMVYGAFWQIPEETYRAVLETNLFGTVMGSRVAVAQFREQRSRCSSTPTRSTADSPPPT